MRALAPFILLCLPLGLAAAPPDNHQRHHLVPDNVLRSSPLHQEAIKRGLYNIDRASNGRYLAETPSDYVSGVSSDLPTHMGSHPKYDKVIDTQIDNILLRKILARTN